MGKQIYLDYNASTPIDIRVREAMFPYLEDYYGNPSTTHWAGRPAKEAFEMAREQVARLLGCEKEEIIFTSGGSESNNHVLKGVYFALKDKGNHIITTKVEHPAIIEPCRFLERLGAKVTYLDVDQYGVVSPEAVRDAIREDTILVSIMHANNEVGSIQPIEEIAAITREKGIYFHTDAAQSVGKVEINVRALGVDFLTVAGHKLYAPKGIGALYIKKGTQIEPLIHGAGHESGRRAGTENIILGVGLGKACELARQELEAHSKNILELRDYFWDELNRIAKGKLRLNGHPTLRLPNTLNVSFYDLIGAEILEQVPEIAASTGSACHSGQVTLSAVLRAMGVKPEEGKGTVRFSLGRYTTKEEIDLAIQLLSPVIG